MDQFHRVTGEFLDNDTERRFRTVALPRMQKDSYLALNIAALLIAMFGISDYNFVGQLPEFRLLLVIRGILVASCLLLAVVVSRSSALLTRPWLYNVAPFLIATGMFTFIALRPGTLPTQLIAAVVVILGFYLFLPNLLWGMIGTSLYLTIGFLIAARYWAGLASSIVFTDSLLLIMANIGGYVVALRLARLQREQFLLEIRLRDMAHTDDLTGLSNRRDFMEKVQMALVAARREGHPLSLCMIDIDEFKSINDTLGHGWGDRVLKEVAGTCRAALCGGEPLGRIGGEEFVAAIPGADLENACRIAEHLRMEVAALRFDGECSDLRVTVTIGVAEVQLQETSFEPALIRADVALYRGKRAGRNTVLAGV